MSVTKNSMQKISRRELIKFTLLGSVVSALGSRSFAKALALIPTPDETEGPFYPVKDQEDKDADLTQIKGHTIAAQGQHIVVSGQVQDVAGHPVAQATLDIWQADAHGRYHHPRDPNPARPDENFQGWAVLHSAYPASGSWIRPPHIHFKVSKPGFRVLTTQMYFPAEKLNHSDLLLNAKSAPERTAMTARLVAKQGNLPVYEYNIVLDLLRR
jgi:protocatechuate 3,4-dioxygenase beta subunit